MFYFQVLIALVCLVAAVAGAPQFPPPSDFQFTTTNENSPIIGSSVVKSPVTHDVTTNEHVSNIKPEPIPSLAALDNEHVLTASTTQKPSTSPSSLISDISSTQQISLGNTQDPSVSSTTEEFIPVNNMETTTVTNVKSTVSPLQTDTFRAYREFLNTWLHLASINLNRPDILKHIQPAVPHHVVQQTQSTTTTLPPSTTTAALSTTTPSISTTTPMITLAATSESATNFIQGSAIADKIDEVVIENLPVETSSTSSTTEHIIIPTTTSSTTTSQPKLTSTASSSPKTDQRIQPSVALIEVTTLSPKIDTTSEFSLLKEEIFGEKIKENKKETSPAKKISKSISSKPKSITRKVIIKSSNAPKTPLKPLSPVQIPAESASQFFFSPRIPTFRYSVNHSPTRGSFFLSSSPFTG